MLTDASVANEICTWPPSRSWTAGAAPLYGTCVSSTPAASSNIAPAKWTVPPRPDDEYVSLSGFAFA